MQERNLEDHLFGKGPKRVLALDGGGVRGLMTCGILEKLEAALRERLPKEKQNDFRLCHYFDVIGGTSTGAIMATWLALGHSAAETRTLYENFSARVFKHASLRSRIGLTAKFNAMGLRQVINEKFEEFAVGKSLSKDYTLRLDDPLIKTGLIIFTKRIDKANPWIIHNHPHGKFWDQDHAPWTAYFQPGEKGTPNRSFELSKVVQASASAPYYLDPIDLTIAKGQNASFIDGGVSPHNNPSFYMLMMLAMGWREGERPEHVKEKLPETVKSPFGFGFATGEDNLLMVSLGTGVWRKEPEGLFKGLAAHKALHALTTMIDDASQLAITGMQALARPTRPDYINFELEDMKGLGIGQPLLSYLRIDTKLESKSLISLIGDQELLKAMRKARARPRKAKAHDKLVKAQLRKAIRTIRQMDNPDPRNLALLRTMGEKLGEAYFGSSDLADLAIPRRFDPW